MFYLMFDNISLALELAPIVWSDAKVFHFFPSCAFGMLEIVRIIIIRQ